MAKEKTKSNIPAEQLELYDKLIATNPKIGRKGATIPYTSLNGNMYSFFSKSGLSIRLPEKIRGDFLKKYKTKLHRAYGRILKEYAEVPDKLLQNTEELKKYFAISYKYAKTLKPKAPAKK